MTAEARSDCRSWFKAGLFNIQHIQSMIDDFSQQACKPVQLQTLKLRGRFAYLMLASCSNHCCRHAVVNHQHVLHYENAFCCFIIRLACMISIFILIHSAAFTVGAPSSSTWASVQGLCLRRRLSRFLGPFLHFPDGSSRVNSGSGSSSSV